MGRFRPHFSKIYRVLGPSARRLMFEKRFQGANNKVTVDIFRVHIQESLGFNALHEFLE